VHRTQFSESQFIYSRNDNPISLVGYLGHFVHLCKQACTLPIRKGAEGNGWMDMDSPFSSSVIPAEDGEREESRTINMQS
jgi:hypothetical protein